MKNKKGSHIGFMLSFSIFVIFLVFTYVTIGQEGFFSEKKKNIIKNLERDFIKEIESDVIIVTILAEEGDKDCVKFSASEFENYSYYVVQKNRQIMEATKEGNELKIKYDETPATLFKIYFSDRFFEGPNANLTGLTCVEAQMKNIQKRKEIFEEKIILMKKNYQYTYDNLKNSLRIPSEKDFGFEFEYPNGTILSTGEKEIFGEVYVEEIPINYFSTEGNFLEGKIRLRVW
jgi:hypothetical protein